MLTPPRAKLAALGNAAVACSANSVSLTEISREWHSQRQRDGQRRIGSTVYPFTKLHREHLRELAGRIGIRNGARERRTRYRGSANRVRVKSRSRRFQGPAWRR